MSTSVEQGGGGLQWVNSGGSGEVSKMDPQQTSGSSPLGNVSDKSSIKGQVRTNIVKGSSLEVIGKDISDLGDRTVSKRPPPRIGSRRATQIAKFQGLVKSNSQSGSQGKMVRATKPQTSASSLGALPETPEYDDDSLSFPDNLPDLPDIPDETKSKQDDYASEKLEEMELPETPKKDSAIWSRIGSRDSTERGRGPSLGRARSQRGKPPLRTAASTPQASTESVKKSINGILAVMKARVGRADNMQDKMTTINEGMVAISKELRQLPPDEAKELMKEFDSQIQELQSDVPTEGTSSRRGTVDSVSEDNTGKTRRGSNARSGSFADKAKANRTESFQSQLSVMQHKADKHGRGSPEKFALSMNKALDALDKTMSKMDSSEQKAALKEVQGQLQHILDKADVSPLDKAKLQRRVGLGAELHPKFYDMFEASTAIRGQGGKDKCLIFENGTPKVVPKSEASPEQRMEAMQIAMEYINASFNGDTSADCQSMLKRITGSQSDEISDSCIQDQLSEFEFLDHNLKIGQLAPDIAGWSAFMGNNSENIDNLFKLLGKDGKLVSSDGVPLDSKITKSNYKRYAKFTSKYLKFQRTKNIKHAPGLPKPQDARDDNTFKAAIEELFKQSAKSLDPKYKDSGSEVSVHYNKVMQMFADNKGSAAVRLNIDFLSRELQWFAAKLLPQEK